MLRLLLVIAAVLMGSAVHAQSLDTALDRLATDSFPETEAAINEIAASGAPNAQAILEAMSARRLVIGADRRVAYTDAGGKTTDARTGNTVEPLGASTVVRLNNRLRGVIDTALGLLTLTSPDRQKRLDSAESIFKSKDLKSLPALEIAIAKETDANVSLALASARGSILLAKADATPAERLSAIDALAARGDQDAMGQIRNALPSLQGDARTAAEAAIGSIERRQRFISGAQNIWYGLSLGSVLLLAAIGLAITFGVMGVINMAHGEMVMLGAYTTFTVQEVFRAYAPDYFGLSLPIAIPLAFLVAGLIGVAIERGIIRFLYGRPLETLLATWGVSLFLQQTVRTIFGPTNRDVASPGYMSGSFDLLGLQITYGRLWIIVFTLVVFALLLLILRRTPLGLQMRAVTQNRKMASSMGIRTPWVDAMTFGLGSGVAGIAGVALSQIDNVSPNLGQSYIIDSFMVVVFGGVGNLWGTLISAFSLGIANKLLEPVAGAVLAKIFILVLLILFIQKRPRGLFALKGRAVEA